MPWLIEYQKQQKIDKEIREQNYYSGEGANPEYYKPMMTLGIKPGIFLGLVGRHIQGHHPKTGNPIEQQRRHCCVIT